MAAAAEARPTGPGRWALAAVLAVALVVTALAALVRFGPETATGRGLIERTLSGLDLGSVGTLHVWGLTGDPWTDPSVARVTLTDNRGVWLDARDLRIRWRPGELLERRVRIISAQAAMITLEHRPSLAGHGGPSRRLPVSVRIDRVRARVDISPAFAGRRGFYALTGAFDLERSGVIGVTAETESLLHLGDHLSVTLNVARNHVFRVDAEGHEAEGGALAGTLGLANDKPFVVAIHAAGSVSAGTVFVDTQVGAQRPLEVRGAWNEAGGQARGEVQLADSSLLSHYRSMLGDQASFLIGGHTVGKGLYDLTLAASAQNASLTARGEANPGALKTGPKGVAIDVRVADAGRIVSFPKLGAAHLAGTLSGDRAHWVLAGTAELSNVSDGPYALARVSGPVRLQNQDRDLLITAAPSGQGGVGRGVLAALLGARPSGTAQITRLADGRLLMNRLSIVGAGLTATATGSRGLLGDLAFRGQARFANLAMAHPGAKGVVDATWTASQSGGSAPWAFSFDARGTDFGSGYAEADHLLGRTPRLTAQGRYGGGTLSLASASLTGNAGAAGATGTVGDNGALGVALTWKARGPFVVGPLEIDGAVDGSGDVVGTLAAPKADLKAAISSIDLPGLPLRSAHLALTFQRRPNGTEGGIGLTADSAYGPAHAAAAFRLAGDGVDLSGVSARAGGASVDGSLELRGGEPSLANLTLAVGPGAFLAHGHADGRVRIVGGRDGASADLSVKASDLVLHGGGPAVKTLIFSADGPLKRLPYKISAIGPDEDGGWRLQGDGDLAEVEGGGTASFAGSGRLRRASFRTLAPAEFTLTDKGVTGRAALGLGKGKADLALADVDGAASIKATVSDVDLALLNRDYVGTLSGTLDAAGHGPELTGGLDVRLAGAGGRDLRGAPPVNGEVKARLAGRMLNVNFQLGNDAGLKALGEVTLAVDASAKPLSFAFDKRRPLSGRFSIDGEIKPLWDLTVGRGGNTLSGQVAASGTLGGTLADPRAVGQVALEHGRFQDEDTGLLLEDVVLRAALADNGVDVSRFTATDGARGQISGQGRANLLRNGASSFRATLTNFRLIETDLARATASGTMTVDRAADGKVRLTGALTLNSAQISPTPPVGAGVTPMAVVEINRPGQIEGAPAEPASAPEAPLDLDVSIRAPRGVFVKGRGLNLELSLDAHVSGTLTTPVLTGTARVVRGDYNFAGQRFQIDDRGVVYLGSTAEAIRLDLTAVRENPTLTATIRITGTAAKPLITLSSNPALPQDEILSQVLFGASASQLSGLEAAQLASAVAGLSGGGGFDLIGGLRTLAHLDRLAVADSAITGTTVSGGKYLTDRIYVELTAGGREGQQAQIEWRVKKHVSLVGILGGAGDSQVAIRWRRSY